MTTSTTTAFETLLPKPKYTGEHEELPAHTQQKGPRVVGADVIDETQITVRVTLPLRRDALELALMIEQRTGPHPTGKG